MTPNELLAGLLQIELALQKTLIDRPFKVFLTNADLDQLELVATVMNRDIAESIMYKAFVTDGCYKDYMVIDGETHDLIAHMLSDRSIELRNGCRG